MATNAGIGYGVLFGIENNDSPSDYDVVGEQTNITPPGISVDAIDATHMQSPNAYREFIPGLIDGGEVAIEINYVPTSAGVTTFLNHLRQVKACRILFPNGARFLFDALLTGFEPEAPIDDKMMASVTFKITGQPLFVPA